MREIRLCLIRVPREFWIFQEAPFNDITPFVEDALAIERRLPKGVNLANERARYRLCCSRIQEAIYRMEKDLETMILGEDYLNFLRYLYQKDPQGGLSSRLAACFFRPGDLESHLKSFQRLLETHKELVNPEVVKRLDFFKKTAEGGGGDGIIEILGFQASDNSSGVPAGNPPRILFLEGPRAVRNHPVDELSYEEEKEIRSILIGQIQKALSSGEAVNFSNQPHPVITEALRAFIYKESQDQKEAMLRVVYMDGSEAEPFPVRCLDPSPDKDISNPPPPLRASLISMRHLEMDEKVDFAWFRNSKVSTPRPFAETDAYCTEQTVNLLKAFGNNPIHLHIFQTGLETAVLGFYRGLVKFIKDRKANCCQTWVKIVPFYFDRKSGSYQAGSPWISFF